jgi:GDP-L-fucose synthase
VRVLVTGAGGAVGVALVEYLRSNGEEVVVVSSRRDCDLEDGAATTAFFRAAKPTQVYHLAGAVFGLGGNTAFPGEAFRRNTLMNVNVIEASRLAGVTKVLGMGSAAIYADGIAQPMSERDALVGEPHASEYAYAFAKRGLLVQLESYNRQYGLDYVYAISTNLYGPHDRFNSDYGHVVPSLLTKFYDAEQNGATVEIWGDGSPTRDFLYSADAAKGLVLMMAEGQGAYNLASGHSRSIADLASAITRAFPTVRYVWDPSKPLGQLRRAYDISKLQGLGFQCDFSLESGLEATVAWIRGNAATLRR